MIRPGSSAQKHPIPFAEIDDPRFAIGGLQVPVSLALPAAVGLSFFLMKDTPPEKMSGS